MANITIHLKLRNAFMQRILFAAQKYIASRNERKAERKRNRRRQKAAKLMNVSVDTIYDAYWSRQKLISSGLQGKRSYTYHAATKTYIYRN